MFPFTHAATSETAATEKPVTTAKVLPFIVFPMVGA
ncbi:hypothetical protein QFZ23_002453 [Arthrobacter globiformis]|nr:hypothetical protein [Arthrobacter globiformis]